MKNFLQGLFAVLILVLSTQAWTQSERGSQAISTGVLSIVASPVLSLEGNSDFNCQIQGPI